MRKRSFLAIGAAALYSGTALVAQTRYPDRAIRLVVPFAPGGDGDIMGRTWVKYVSSQTGINIIVDMRTNIITYYYMRISSTNTK